jgi:hypothetical protein
MAGSDSAYPKETKVNCLSDASHFVSFAGKIESKEEKEMSNRFLSFFLAFLHSSFLSFLLYPSQYNLAHSFFRLAHASTNALCAMKGSTLFL